MTAYDYQTMFDLTPFYENANGDKDVYKNMNTEYKWFLLLAMVQFMANSLTIYLDFRKRKLTSAQRNLLYDQNQVNGSSGLSAHQTLE